MAEGQSPAGLSIPGSALRKKKTYSVSLRDKNFGISEVPDADVSFEEDGDNNPQTEKCQSCGQKLPAVRSSAAVTTINEQSPASQLSRSLPAELQINRQDISKNPYSFSLIFWF